jgi:hypothetical protein
VQHWLSFLDFRVCPTSVAAARNVAENARFLAMHARARFASIVGGTLARARVTGVRDIRRAGFAGDTHAANGSRDAIVIGAFPRPREEREESSLGELMRAAKSRFDIHTEEFRAILP